MRRRRHRLRGWALAALAVSTVVPSACGGRSALDDGFDVAIGGELAAGSGGAHLEPATGGAASGGAGGWSGDSAGAAGHGGTALAGVGGSGFSGAAGAAIAGAAGSASGGAAGASVGGGAGSGSAPPVQPEACAVSTPLDGGFARCDSGLLHRPAAGGVCANALPRARAFEPDVLFALERGARDAGYVDAELPLLYACREDADCAERPSGYCDLASPGGWSPGSSFTACRYGCSSDADCGGGTLCQCGEPAGRCVSATCFDDSECGAGLLCAPYDPSPGCESPGVSAVWACQERDDECSVDAHCASGLSCTFLGGRRICAAPACGS